MRTNWRRRLFWPFAGLALVVVYQAGRRHAQLDREPNSGSGAAGQAVAAAAAELVQAPQAAQLPDQPAADGGARPPPAVAAASSPAAAAGPAPGAAAPAPEPAPVPAPSEPQGAPASQSEADAEEAEEEELALRRWQVQQKEADAKGTKCKPPRPVTRKSIKVPRGGVAQEGLSLEEILIGKTFAWCHDGTNKVGEFSLNKGGVTGGDFQKWELKRWKVTGPHEVTVDNGSNGNVHRLTFNCGRTGFFVDQSRQRGYVEGAQYSSPDSAGAPTSSEAPDCRVYGSVQMSGRLPVWVWWDFRHGVPPSFQLNLRTWRKHLHPDKFELHLVNATNIHQFLPGVPEAFFRFYQAAKSDFLRAGLLAIHGGVYLDGDILLSHDMDEVVRDILEDKADVLPYEGPGDRCPDRYTTNFMAGRKGNALSSKWISVTLRAMVNQCDLDESQNHREPVKVCCFQKDWCMRNECHVAWGDISHPPALSSLEPGSVRMGCVPFHKGFAYTMNGEELFWKLVTEHPGRKQCKRSGADLQCSPPVGVLTGYFDRHGHHLYNMLNGYALDGKTQEQILSSDMVVSELYRLSLGT